MPLRAVAVAVLVALALAACGGEDEAAAPAATAEPPAADACRDVETPQPRPEGALQAPTEILDAERTYRVRVATNCGEFTIALEPETSPQAVASFVALAERGFFDETVFHRIVPGFVIQGGDPTATGTGGPGYSTVDTPAPDTSYEKGVVAMAKTGADPPGTAGSQFFVVAADGVTLPPDYAVIGRVTEGMDVVDRIAILGDPGTELPLQPVVIESMTVDTSG